MSRRGRRAITFYAADGLARIQCAWPIADDSFAAGHACLALSDPNIPFENGDVPLFFDLKRLGGNIDDRAGIEREYFWCWLLC